MSWLSKIDNALAKYIPGYESEAEKASKAKNKEIKKDIEVFDRNKYLNKDNGDTFKKSKPETPGQPQPADKTKKAKKAQDVPTKDGATQEPEQEEKVSYNYKVKKGDSIYGLIDKMEYQGTDAIKYRQALTAKLRQNKLVMNDKDWLRMDDNIELLTSEELKRLGIKEDKSSKLIERKKKTKDDDAKVDAKDNDGTVKSKDDDGKVKTKDDEGTVKSKDNEGTTPVEAEQEVDEVEEVQKNSIDKIKERIEQDNQKCEKITVDKLNDKQKKEYENYKKVYKTEPELLRNTTNGDVHLFFDTEQTEVGKKSGEQSTEIVFVNNSKNNVVVKNRYYNNGKIVQDLEYDSYNKEGKVERATESKVMQKPVIKDPPKTELKIDESVPITDVKIPDKFLAAASDKQKQEMNDFVKSLQDNKADLMADLGLDNDQYNEYVKMSIAIAIHESGLERGITTERSLKNAEISIPFTDISVGTQDVLDTVRAGNVVLNETFGGDRTTATSKGMTQIKIGDWNDDEEINGLFRKYQVTQGSNEKFDGYFDNLNGTQSAVATMIVLNDLSKQLNREVYQDAISAANGKVRITDKVNVEGKAVDLEEGYYINTVTKNDALVYLYNGRTGVLKRGDATPAEWVYTSDVRRYMEEIEVVEDPVKRAEAEQNAQLVTEGESTKSKRDDLSWGIGQVAFGTSLYTTGVSKNTKEEIETMRQSLTERGFNQENIDKLEEKMTNGDIAFLGSLTTEELDSMTEPDLTMLVSYSDDLNTRLSSVSSYAEKRNIAKDMDKKFKQDYLTRHAKRTDLDSVRSHTISLADEGAVTEYSSSGYGTGTQKRCTDLFSVLTDGCTRNYSRCYDQRIANGEYLGFTVQKDKGINTSNASEIDVMLAKNGADAANTLNTSGRCATGVKQALIGSGVAQQSELDSYGKAYKLTDFFNSHPDRFIEVTHIQMNDRLAREITAGDLSHLPAGCIVVFGNKARDDVSGHVAITSGNGQMYADETDNSNWDNFAKNNKGEHGYVRVYKLNPDYYTYDAHSKKIVPRK